MRIGRQGMPLVAALPAAEIAAITLVRTVLGKGSCAEPRLQQSAIDREVLFADQLAQAGQQHRVLKELLGDLGVEQPVMVEGKRGVTPYRVVDVQTHEPAEQPAVVKLLH